jgi:hypothetical protein
VYESPREGVAYLAGADVGRELAATCRHE